MKLLFRGLLAGLGFGLAAVTVDMLQLLLPTLFNRIAPSVSITALNVAFEFALLAVAGALLSPLLLLRGGRIWHLAVLAAGWWALQLWFVVDTLIIIRLTQIGAPLAFLLTLAGLALGRRRPGAAVAVGVGLLASVIAAPHVFLALTTPSRAEMAELPPARPGAPDVVLIVLDTVRAENMSAYGYERPTTPVFEALAKQGVLYLDATSPSTWSLASHASLFTGVFPSAHGAHFEHRFLNEARPTLAEVLAAAGYDTRCFTANAFISDSLGLTRGFAWSDEAWRGGAGGRQFSFAGRLLDWLGFGAVDKGGADVASNFERWAAETPADAGPTFAFVNFLEAHFPYHQLPDEYLTLFTDLPMAELREHSMQLFAAQFGGTAPDPAQAMGPATDMYDGGIVYTDWLLGRIIEALRARGTLDDTLLIVMADHGELLGEHGTYGHGRALYEPGIHVPLLLRYPAVLPAGARVETPVSTVGVFATVLDLLDIEPPALHVESLLPAVSGGPPGGPVMSERHQGPSLFVDEEPDPMADGGVRVRTYRVGSLKLVETSGGDLLLFDLASDPAEMTNLAESRPQDVARLMQELDDWRAALGLPAIDAEVEYGETPEVDPAARERLRALGYVE